MTHLHPAGIPLWLRHDTHRFSGPACRLTDFVCLRSVHLYHLDKCEKLPNCDQQAQQDRCAIKQLPPG